MRFDLEVFINNAKKLPFSKIDILIKRGPVSQKMWEEEISFISVSFPTSET